MYSRLTCLIIAVVIAFSLSACKNATKIAAAYQLLHGAQRKIQQWDANHPTCKTCGGSGEVYYIDNDGNRISDDFECPTCKGDGFISNE